MYSGATGLKEPDRDYRLDTKKPIQALTLMLCTLSLTRNIRIILEVGAVGNPWSQAVLAIAEG
jgi:hypothetical protein